MRGKFIYHFANGAKIVDGNGYQTMAQAKRWATANNRGTTIKGYKVVRVVKRKMPTRRRVRRQSNPFAMNTFKVPSIRGFKF